MSKVILTEDSKYVDYLVKSNIVKEVIRIDEHGNILKKIPIKKMKPNKNKVINLDYEMKIRELQKSIEIKKLNYSNFIQIFNELFDKNHLTNELLKYKKVINYNFNKNKSQIFALIQRHEESCCLIKAKKNKCSICKQIIIDLTNTAKCFYNDFLIICNKYICSIDESYQIDKSIKKRVLCSIEFWLTQIPF